MKRTLTKIPRNAPLPLATVERLKAQRRADLEDIVKAATAAGDDKTAGAARRTLLAMLERELDLARAGRKVGASYHHKLTTPRQGVKVAGRGPKGR